VAWILVALLAIVSVTNVARGMRRAWLDNGDVDMQARADEYRWFCEGVYPNYALAGSAAPRSLPYTVYPPYALPMFAAYFEPGGLVQGRILVEILSIASLILIGAYGHRELRPAGPALAAVGAVAGTAITGVIGAFAAGQFSIVCMAFLVLQILFLERHKPVAAGVCWSLAMLKPQIALAFAVLFVTERQWRGLLVGLAILAALSLLACAWTGVSAQAVLHHWAFKASMAWAADTGTPGPGELARSMGIATRIGIGAALAVFVGLVAAAWYAAMRLPHRIPLLPLAGACGAAGELLFYHQFYDHIMLAPTLFAMFLVAAMSRSPATTVLAGLLAISVWLPQRFVPLLPYHRLLVATIWIVAAATLLKVAIRAATTRQETIAPVA